MKRQREACAKLVETFSCMWYVTEVITTLEGNLEKITHHAKLD